MLVMMNTGAGTFLNLLLKDSATPGANDWGLRLFTNDYEPVPGSVLADFTKATFTGYFDVVLERSLWSAVVIDGDKAKSQWGAAPFTWTPTAGVQTVYGYVVFDIAGAVALWAERFAEPRALTVGQPFGLLPKMTLGTELLL